MRKFIRKDREDVEVQMIAAEGAIETISKNSKENVNGKKFWTFTAKLEATRGPLRVLGQVYEGSLSYLDGLPIIGDRFTFATSIESLKEKNNKVWGIVGRGIDEISTELLDDIDQLDF